MTTQLIHLDTTCPPSLPHLCLSIGNFDGVHLGHQAMIATLKKEAYRLNLKTAVMIFEPQPREFFDFLSAPARLSSLEEKYQKLTNLGVDYVLVVKFDTTFAKLSADAFCQLLMTLNVKSVVVGDDFRFGQGRQGDTHSLQKHFLVHILQGVQINGARISSTAIRHALAHNDLQTAKRLLGYEYAITGIVVQGDKIGRQLGFATANVALNRQKPALLGIYAADVIAYQDERVIDLHQYGGGIRGLCPNSLFGAVNIGTRPSVHGKDYRLEVHFPHFVGDLYGLSLQVIFRHYLHGERSYSSLETLKLGIQNDVDALITWHNQSISSP